MTAPNKAHSHSWYPQHCCSDKDCSPVEVDDVVEIENGAWKHLPTGVVFPKEKVHPSLDGKFHVCIGNMPYNMNHPYCIFILQGT